MRNFLLITMIASLASPHANACIFAETPANVGKFNGEVFGRFIDRDYIARPLFQLDRPLVYYAPDNQEYAAIEQYIVDGASIPRVFWSVIGGPFSGNHLKASIVHDYYTDTCQVFPHPEPGRSCQNELAVYAEDRAVHLNYYLGMLAAGVPENTACAEYIAVSTYKQWDLDENGQPNNIRVFGRPIGETDSNFLSRSFGIVWASVGAVIKTRKSTHGQSLNFFPDGEIPATPEGFQSYVQQLAEVLDNESYLENPDLLGLLTNEQSPSFEVLEPWSGQFLAERFNPQTGEFSNLTHFEPKLPSDISSLSQSLGLIEQPTTYLPQVNFEDVTIDQLNSDETKLRFLDLLTNADPRIPESIDLDQLRLYPNNDQTGVSYEFAPGLVDELGNRQVELPFGKNGNLLFHDGQSSGHDLLIQPSPMR